MKKQNSQNKKKWSLKKKIIVGCSSFIGAIIIILAAVFLPPIISPMSQFNTISNQFTALPSSSDAQGSEPADQPSASASGTLDPYDQLAQQGDFSILQNTVNILLIGVDYAPERDTWSGKHDYHSDVAIVLSINKETNQVSLISLPRDTYADIPGVDGIYKINDALNCGGDWPSQAACQQVCKAASWMIGGLPVNYYFAVDMTAVKNLVDQIGGVDFNVDIAFTMDGRSYKTGMQHMNGQGALDYMRVRKGANIVDPSSDETGDLNRINRQKDMLVAIFQKIKDGGLLTQIPALITNFDSNHLATNVSLPQIAALAAYSINVNSADIKLYSMGGTYSYGLFGWNFVITDQDNRRDIINKVFGVDIVNDKAAIQTKFGVTVPSYSSYDLSSAMKLWEKMQIEVTGKQAKSVLDNVKAKLDADALLPPEPTPSPSPSEPVSSPTDTASAASSSTISGASVSFNMLSSILNASFDSTQYRKYPSDGPVWALYNKCETEYTALTSWSTYSDTSGFNTLIGTFQTDVKNLATTFSIKLSGDYWKVIYNTYEGKINQSYVKDDVAVDFR